MNKIELIHKTIKSIRNDIESFYDHASSGNDEMCKYACYVINGKISLLLDMELINIEQWGLLNSIINKMLLKNKP